MTAPHSSERPSHEQIAQRAQQIWESEGKPNGRAFEHWIQAERDIMEAAGRRSATPTANPAPVPSPSPTPTQPPDLASPVDKQRNGARRRKN